MDVKTPVASPPHDCRKPESEMSTAGGALRAARRALLALLVLGAVLLYPYARLPLVSASPTPSHRMPRLRFGTWNVRYDGRAGQPVPIPPAGDGAGSGVARGEMPWSERRSKITDTVLWEELDVIGFQEALVNQVEDLAALLGPTYSWVGVGRDDGQKAGEYVPIFFRNARLAPIATRHFWLSETPNVPGSVSWDAGQTRMVTLIHFRDLASAHLASSRDDIWVLNTHWDDRGVESRTEAAKVILREVNALLEKEGGAGMRGKPVVLLGDLNSPSREEGYGTLTGHIYSPSHSSPTSTQSQLTFLDSRHALAVARHSHSPSRAATPLQSAAFGDVDGTFTGFNSQPQHGIIDFILMLDNGALGEGGWTVSRFGVVPNQFEDGRGRMYISDHKLVVAALERA